MGSGVKRLCDFRRLFSAPTLASGQEQLVGPVALLGNERIAEPVEKALELGPVALGHLERAEHAAEVGPVVPVMEEADVPAIAQLQEELHERTRPLGELEAIEPARLHGGWPARGHR